MRMLIITKIDVFNDVDFDIDAWNYAADQCRHIPGWTEQVKFTQFAGWKAANNNGMLGWRFRVGGADDKSTHRFSMDDVKGWMSNVAKGTNLFSLPPMGKMMTPSPIFTVPRVPAMPLAL